ncbi:hypothetical protein AMEX_G3421 [Astyanax mexicanus]|uniref:Uncharacterized protein n=1 Tax=Astyanax mexicanus TaxID=7994 RepID=A0A8T2MIR1_ASTMX|nr:hypothetical protein AMEX_G3421 [Astyanax mexicanus]
MAEFIPFTERYLLRLIYYTASGPSSTESGKEQWYETHTALVRVTNTGDKQLSKCNIESLALSIPELNHRAMGYRNVPILLYTILIWVENIPLDLSLPHRTRAQLSSNLYSQPRPQTDCQASTSRASPLPPLLAPSESDCCVTADHPSSDSFFTAGLNHKEWTTVTYRDYDFIRSICPVYSTDDEVDVIWCCSVSDYTAYGQLVFSVDMDFLCEAKQVDSNLSCDGTPEGMNKDQKMANCRPVSCKTS